MIPNKAGQIVKFHTVLEGENPLQNYVVLELQMDSDPPKAKIQALNTGLPYAPINVVRLNDLEVMEINTNDLIGHVVFILTDEKKKILGRIISVNEQSINLDLEATSEGIYTNVYVTIVDNNEQKHTGTLFVTS